MHEPADGLHTTMQDEQLRDPKGEEADPAQIRKPQELALCETLQSWEDPEQEDDHGHGGQPRLDPVPEDGDDRPDQSRDVGSEQPEAEARQHWIGDAVPLPRNPREVHEEVDDGYADDQREEHLPTREA